MTVGELEKGALFLIMGYMPVIILAVLLWIPLEILLMMFMSIIIMTFAYIYIGYQIVKNKCRPLIDKIDTDHIVWHRFTKDGVYMPQIVRKGPYGQTKGIMYGAKADIINKGDFPVKCVNGNQGIIVYDMRSTNVNLKHTVAWKKIFNREKVRSGKDAYLKAKREGQTMKKQEETLV